MEIKEIIKDNVYLIEDFITEEEEEYLFYILQEIPWVQKFIQINHKKIPIPRLTYYYGQNDYEYSGITNTVQCIPEELDAIRIRIQDVTKTEFNNILLNLYRDGNDNISYHSDDEKELGEFPMVASLSLGHHRRFLFKNKNTKKVTSLVLNSRSLLVMLGDCQKDYFHAIPKQPLCKQSRISLTYRNIKKL